MLTSNSRPKTRVLDSTAYESRPAEAAIANLKTGMPAITYEQDSEININEGSFNETPATPIAGQDPENYYNDHGVTVAKTVTVSILHIVRINMPAITIRNSEIA